MASGEPDRIHGPVGVGTRGGEISAGADLAAARADADRTMDAIGLAGGHFRTDIALAAAEGRIAL